MKFAKWYFKSAWSLYRNIKSPYKAIFNVLTALQVLNIFVFGISALGLDFFPHYIFSILLLSMLGFDLLISTFYYLKHIKNSKYSKKDKD